MALIPVVSVGSGVVVLSLQVDDATRAVTGWQVQNDLPGPVRADVVCGGFSAHPSIPAGLTTGTVPKNRQWNFDADSGMSYSLSVAWTPGG